MAKVTYTVGSTPESSFVVPFEFWLKGDLTVSVGGVETTGFTTYGGNDPAGGSIALGTAVSDTTVEIERTIDCERYSDFPTYGAFRIEALNDELDRIVAKSCDNATNTEDLADISYQSTDDSAPFVTEWFTGDAAYRVSKLVGFDSGGDPLLMTPATNEVMTMTREIYTAGVAQTVFPLSAHMSALTFHMVFVAGIHQPDGWTVAGGDLVLDTAPSEGDTVTIYGMEAVDSQFTYDTLAEYWADDTVQPEGSTIFIRRERMSFHVTPLNAHINHPASGQPIRATTTNGGYDPRSFGAAFDGATDDAVALQTCVNAAATDGVSVVILPAGKAFLGSDLYLSYDAVNNPGFPGDPLEGGRLRFAGKGAMTRRDWEEDRTVGTVFEFGAGFKMILSAAGGSRGWNQVVTNLSVLGSGATLISNPYATSNYEMSDLFVGNAVPVAGQPTVYISDNYVGFLRDILIIGDKTQTTGRTGIGIHIDPSDTAGGANRYENITAAWFDTAIKIGRDYDPAKTTIAYNSRANFAVNLQSQESNTGIHLAQGCCNMTLTACWTEACDVAPFLVDNSARNIEFVSCSGAKNTGDVTHRGILVIGNDTGTAGVDAAYGVMVRNSRFFCEGGAGVHCHDDARDVVLEGNSFHNGGAAAVAVEAGFGGEVTLRGNNYHPEAAASEVPTSRRVCVISGPSGSETYTAAPERARELDYAPGRIAADVNASGWRHPPREIVFNTSAASRTLTLPDLSALEDFEGRVRVLKPSTANTVTIDAQAGSTIKGVQTYVMTEAYSFVELVHNGATVWDIASE